ncbi:hypothetical protein R0J91_22820, partial [Micrococcus sp. SIMBA_131]
MTELTLPKTWFGMTAWSIPANNTLTAPIGIHASPNRTVEMIGLPMSADKVHDKAPNAKQTI